MRVPRFVWPCASQPKTRLASVIVVGSIRPAVHPEMSLASKAMTLWSFRRASSQVRYLGTPKHLTGLSLA